MKVSPKTPPRVFSAGQPPVRLSHVADVELASDEILTITLDGREGYDVARKDWGFYATPSLNGRLKSAGLRACLAQGAGEKRFILLVEQGREESFHAYLAEQGMAILFWLDGDEALTPPG